MNCVYCYGSIITDEFGWGYFIESEFEETFNESLIGWHSECFQEVEGIAVEA